MGIDMFCLVCGIWPAVAGGFRCQACRKYWEVHKLERPAVLIERDRSRAELKSADEVWGRIGRSIVRRKNGCWEWTGAKVHGLGRVSVKGRPQYVHRLIYQGVYGPIPRGAVVRNTCQNRGCVYPGHLAV